jgi:hypothetical protein
MAIVIVVEIILWEAGETKRHSERYSLENGASPTRQVPRIRELAHLEPNLGNQPQAVTRSTPASNTLRSTQ